MKKAGIIIFSLFLLSGCGGGSDGDPAGNGGNSGNGSGTNPPEQPEQPGEPGEPAWQKIYVSSIGELNAVRDLSGGDTVVLRNGTYANERILLRTSGSQDKPVVLMGETPGRTILTGTSRLSLSGEHIVVRDLWFRDVVSTHKGAAPIEFRSSTTVFANNCRVTNCAVTGFNTQQEKAVDYKWVSIFGRGNTVDNCTFADKKNLGTLLVVWLQEGVVARHTIRNNYFSRPQRMLDNENKVINGQETIRIGDSGTSMQRAECLVENNYFYQCNGEGEAISNKSCFNTYRSNVMESSQGSFTMRHGNDCLVEGNYFLGNNVDETGGVRIIGERHTVRNNYLENLKGTGYSTAICVVRGVENSLAHEYFQVKDAVITGNVIVNCANGIYMNYGSSNMQMPVISTTVSGNTISNNNSSNVAIRLYTEPVPSVTWTANTVWGGKYVGISTAEVPKAPSQPTIPSKTTEYIAIRNASGASWNINQ